MRARAVSRAIVDLSAYAANLEAVREMVPASCGVIPVVKADAYGHGAIPVARRAVDVGIEMVAVATVEEGIELREAGIDVGILVMLQPPERLFEALLEHDLRPMISEVNAADRLGELARHAGRVVSIHCKVDTGMGRQGFGCDEVVSSLRRLSRISHIDLEGIATHFPVAESRGDAFTTGQIGRFKGLLDELDREGIPYGMAHAANSAAIVNHPGSTFDAVRPGLITYGVWPTEIPPQNPPVRPVLRWEADVVLVRELEAGSTVGYGRTFTVEQATRVAVIPVGYADGYKYGLSNRGSVLIRGTRCPVLGRVSMDQIVADVSSIPDAVPGDVATLVGSDGGESITVSDLAALADTIPYDILTGIGRRVERVYVG